MKPPRILLWRVLMTRALAGVRPLAGPATSRLPSTACSPLDQAMPKSKNPGVKFTGVLVLATSYSRTAFRRTTIGAAAFHFRVRNGNGWCHYANVTRAEKRAYAARLWWRRFAPRDVGRGGSPNRLGDWGQSPLPEISKERSALSLGTDSLASTYRFSETNPLRTADATTSEF